MKILLSYQLLHFLSKIILHMAFQPKMLILYTVFIAPVWSTEQPQERYFWLLVIAKL